MRNCLDLLRDLLNRLQESGKECDIVSPFLLGGIEGCESSFDGGRITAKVFVFLVES